MTGVMACCALLSFSVLLTGRKVIRYKATSMEVNEEIAEMINTS
jgi:hypothetical protein